MLSSRAMRWIVRGDIGGFFGLAIDNLVQLLLIDSLCRGVLGFPAELVYGRILPGAAISVLVGNVAYALQAKRLAERTGRADVCALPYGINTVSLFAHVFLVMLPARCWQHKSARPIRREWPGRRDCSRRCARASSNWSSPSSPSGCAGSRRVRRCSRRS